MVCVWFESEMAAAGSLLRLWSVVALSLLPSATAWLTITSLVDTLPNASFCNPYLPGQLQPPPDCNLRSAIEYCVTNSSYLLNDCTIFFPTNNSHIFMNEYIGEMLVTNVTGRITLIGNGCLISGTGLRLFNILIDPAVHSFHFSISNLQISGFGNQLSTILLDGGAIFLDGLTSASFHDTTFLNNNAYQGGALALQSSSNISLTNCHFILNLAAVGGAVLIGSFNSQIHFHQTTFDLNSAISASGGAIQVLTNNRNLTFTDCLFQNNHALSTGGGIHILELNQQVLFSNTSFVKNSIPQDTTMTQQGGAIYIGNNNIDLQVSYCQFMGNTAYSGGGMYLGSSNEILVTHSSFVSNNVTDDGGGIYFYNQNTATVVSSNFTHHFSDFGAGAAIFGLSYNHLQFSDLLIASNTGNQGAAITLYQFHSFPTFDRVHFLHNRGLNQGSAAIDLGTSSVYYEFTNCVFEGNVATLDGGAFNIGTYTGEVNFIDCVFLGNSAEYGGAGYISLQASLIMFQNCVFQNGTARAAGAVFFYSINPWILFENCQFLNNSADRGGAVLILSDCFELAFKGCSFHSNVALENGGAIYLDTRVDISVTDTQFISNRAGIDGGALYLAQDNSVSIDGGTFQENQAINGGAVAATNRNSGILITRTLFFHNSGTINGGGVAAQDSNENIEIDDCVFDSNTAGRAGGAISIQSDNFATLVRNSTFLGNSATSAGGGIYSALANPDLEIKGCNFTKNFARYGGGMYVGDYHNPLSILNSNFTANLAEYGSGLYISPFNANALIHQTTFDMNIALLEAAGLMSYASPLILTSCKFTDNIAFSSSSGYLHADQILVSDVDVINGFGSGDTGGLFIEETSDLEIRSSTFRNNSGAMGGGLFIYSSRSILLKNCFFLANEGVVMAGALWVDESVDLVIQDSRFFSNQASRGGAISANQVESLTLSNSQFEDNLALQDAGAILFNTGRFVINNTIFSRNIAGDGCGSAVYLIATQSFLARNQFINNSALQGAGAVYWQYWTLMPEPVGLQNNIFSNNTAAYGPEFATEGTRLLLSDANQYDVIDYTSSLPPLAISLQDFYQQTIKTESSSVIDLSILQQYECYDHIGYISGGVIDQMENGIANFTSLDAYCAPGYSMTIVAQSSVDFIPSVNFTLSFRTCEVGEYYNGYSCQMCETGTYSLASSSSLDDMSQIEVCQRCPSEVNSCSGSTIDMRDGYWRISQSSDVIFACPTGTAGCKGGEGSGDEICHEGYHGPLCSLCQDGYGLSKSTYTCVQCRQTNGFDEIAIIFTLFVGLILLSLLWYFFHPAAKKIHNFEDFILAMMVRLQPNRTQRSSVTPRELIQAAKVMSKRMFARLKVYMTLYQILSVLPFVLDMTFPNPLSFFIASWKFLSGTMSDSTLPACNAHSYDFIDSLVVETLSPLVVTLLIFATRGLHIIYSRRSKESSTEPTPPDAIPKIKANYFMIFLLWTYFILPSVSTKIFQTFR
jgi:predicted outer membrane repeat protein